jgi:2'-5' RNA ligase
MRMPKVRYVVSLTEVDERWTPLLACKHDSFSFKRGVSRAASVKGGGSVSPLPVHMEDHWSPVPGVDPGRARLMWLMRVGDAQQVAELARLGQARLAGLAGLDMVPREWLHMTTLIAGFADEISSGQVEAMAGQARRLLAGTPPITVILGRVLYHARAVMLAAQPASALEPVLHAVQEATRIVTGRDGALHHKPWTPHVTLAYANTARSAGPVIEALGRNVPAQQVAISSVSLVSQAPEQMWTWRLVADVPFGTGSPVQAQRACS